VTSRGVIIWLVFIVMVCPSAISDPGCSPGHPQGQIGVDPVPPMVSSLKMETPDKNPLREIRISLNISDYNGFEDIATVEVSLYYFNEKQANAKYTQYEDNTSIKVDRFEDLFGGFLDLKNSDAYYSTSSNWIEQNTTLRIEFYFKPVPVTDLMISASDRTGMSIHISTAITPSARPSKIKEAYIPWVISIVIASIAAIALFWIRNTSNRLAKIAEEQRRLKKEGIEKGGEAGS